jgi:DNA repair exonuclease SbcCD nuclease subunit
MTKIAIITDQHFGARNDSQVFLDYYEDFYKNVFFPKLKEEGICELLILGDTFDRRKYINFNTLQRAKSMFFDELERNEIYTYMLVGNHDTFYKNTNEVNSVRILSPPDDHFLTVIDSPREIDIDGHKICMSPWICADNYQESLELIKNTDAMLCCGHFEIEGFSMYRGHACQEGLNRDLFRKFEYTFSGHYHHKSSSDGIHYLGNPYELTWQDYQDPRGFHTFDLDSRTLTFHRNPYVMFHRLVYDDSNGIIEGLQSGYEHLKDRYVKVIVVNKVNPYLFDRFMDAIYSVEPADVKIVEDFSDPTEGLDDDMVNQAEDTLTILNKYIDTVESHLDNSKLKNIMRELYVEAVNSE